MLVPILLAVVMSGVPNKSLRIEKVDVIEHNTCGDVEQFIFWDWSPDYKRYDCQGWRLVGNSGVTRYGDRYCVIVGKTKVTAPIFRRTITDVDPERQNAVLFPEKYRRKLW